MQLNRFTDYSLRVLMYLEQQPANEKVPLETLARLFNMNRHHLNKVSQRLAALGWVISSRGKNGGLIINETARDLKLSEIVATLEPDTRPMDCEGVQCPVAGGCNLEMILLDASQAFLHVLSQYKLSDIKRGPTFDIQPLLSV